ncbi:DUF2784 domain-containing protein [bacterium]|nr:DUF2784 domain-containing protein [bacterium]MBU1638323.1 DUF2784 domain-containing protein [bacterium]
MTSFYDNAATAVLVFHAVWIVWVVCGAFVTKNRRTMKYLHLGCVLSTLVVQAMGMCPLTDLEQRLQLLAGRAGYTGGFIEHYAAVFVYGDLVTFPPAAMMVGLAFILAVSLWVHLKEKMTV